MTNSPVSKSPQKPQQRFFGAKIRRTLLIWFIIMVLEGLIAYIDQTSGDRVPAGYFYIIPVVIGGLYLGYFGGIGVPVLSIVLFHIVEKAIHHRAYAEADFLWLILLIVLGTITAETQRDRQRARQHSRELEQLNRAREELTALIVHDLRTPLAGLLNVMRSIEEENRGTLSSEHVELLEIALSTGEGMSGMIRDLLSLHAMENGALELHETELRPEEIIEEAVKQVAPLARQRKVEMHINAVENPPLFLADKKMLQRVLVNLLGNALRFSPEGSEIRIETQRSEAEIIFSVADAGPGVPSHLQERIFEKFASIDHEAGKHISTGLGLAFSKMAVQAHSGRIWLESPWITKENDRPAKGSRFFFTLPLAQKH